MKLKAGFSIAAVMLLVGAFSGGDEAGEGQLPTAAPPPLSPIGGGDTPASTSPWGGLRSRSRPGQRPRRNLGW